MKPLEIIRKYCVVRTQPIVPKFNRMGIRQSVRSILPALSDGDPDIVCSGEVCNFSSRSLEHVGVRRLRIDLHFLHTGELLSAGYDAADKEQDIPPMMLNALRRTYPRPIECLEERFDQNLIAKRD
jgi:hypothetical protein